VLRLRKIEKENPENYIDREKLDAFDPVRLAVSADLKQYVDRGHDRDHFRHCEFQVHWSPEKVREKNQHGRDEKCDLQAGADRDADAQVHLVFHRHENGGRVLCRVAHNRHHDHTDKHLGQADGIPDVFDRADKKLREHGDQGGGDEQNGNGLAARPLPAALFGMCVSALEEMLVGPERETEHAEIGKKQNNGDGQGQLLLDQRAPPARTAVGGEMKDRRDDESDRGQRERDDGSAGCGAVETLFFIFSAAEQNGEAEHQQHVTDDRSGNGGFHHIDQPFGKGNAGDNQFRGVSESGVEQPSQTFPDAGGQRFGGASDPARDRNDAESRANEEQSRTDASGPEAQKDRERNEDKKPVEGGFEFQKSGNFATCLQLINPSVFSEFNDTTHK
jgi:hypothetical protein